VSNIIYSQRIRVIGKDTFVTLTVPQAKAVNDTFISQRKTISELKNQNEYYKDSLQRFQSKPHSVDNSVGWEGWLFITIEGIIFIALSMYYK
jgi:hypothetical protein